MFALKQENKQLQQRVRTLLERERQLTAALVRRHAAQHTAAACVPQPTPCGVCTHVHLAVKLTHASASTPSCARRRKLTAAACASSEHAPAGLHEQHLHRGCRATSPPERPLVTRHASRIHSLVYAAP